jgi:prevent-host-death family protein
METVNIHQAKTNLSRLLSLVEMGEEVIIANRGVPVAKLIPYRENPKKTRPLGAGRGLFTVPDDFDAPLPEEILKDFEGGNG